MLQPISHVTFRTIYELKVCNLFRVSNKENILVECIVKDRVCHTVSLDYIGRYF